MKRLVLIMFMLPSFFACGGDDDANITKGTLTVNVFEEIEVTGAMVENTGAVVYLFEGVKFWDETPLKWDYEYVADGKIKNKETGEIKNYSKKSIADVGGAKFVDIQRGIHGIVVISNLYDQFTMLKVNLKDSNEEVNVEFEGK